MAKPPDTPSSQIDEQARIQSFLYEVAAADSWSDVADLVNQIAELDQKETIGRLGMESCIGALMEKTVAVLANPKSRRLSFELIRLPVLMSQYEVALVEEPAWNTLLQNVTEASHKQGSVEALLSLIMVTAVVHGPTVALGTLLKNIGDLLVGRQKDGLSILTDFGESALKGGGSDVWTQTLFAMT